MSWKGLAAAGLLLVGCGRTPPSEAQLGKQTRAPLLVLVEEVFDARTCLRRGDESDMFPGEGEELLPLAALSIRPGSSCAVIDTEIALSTTDDRHYLVDSDCTFPAIDEAVRRAARVGVARFRPGGDALLVADGGCSTNSDEDIQREWSSGRVRAIAGFEDEADVEAAMTWWAP